MKDTQLQEYARFLLQHHLDEFTSLNIQRAHAVQLPLLKLFSHFSEAELFAYSRQSLQTLLTDLAEGRAMETHLDSVQRWKENRVPEVPSLSIEARDLAFSIHTRKFALYRLLKRYAPTIDQYETIAQQIELFFSRCHASSVEAFAEIQQQALQASHEEVRTQQEVLETANRELQEHLTHLEEAQQALSESEARLREAQAIAHLGHYRYEQKRQLLYWSDEMKAIFGINPTFADLAGEGYFSLIHPEDRDPARRVFEKAVQAQEPFSLEHRVIRPDGSVRWVLLQGRNSYSDVSGQRVDGTCLDITERKEADLRVQEEQYFVRRLSDTSPDVITLYDLELGRNLYSSREIYALLGFSEEELEQIRRRGQQAFVDYFHPDDIPVILNFLETYKTYRGDAPREMEYRVKNHQGEWVYIYDRYSVFRRNAAGFPTQIMGIARDVTDRKLADQEIERKNHQLQEAYEEMAAAQEELRQTNEELFRVNALLEQRIAERTQELEHALTESHRQNQALLKTNADLDNFVYTASHDLKAPIANLEGITLLLERKLADRLDRQETELLAMVGRMAGRLKSTIQDLTEITKVQKQLEESAEAISFGQVLEDVCTDLLPQIQETSARITTDWAVPDITYARKHLRSILYNLLSNALKYRSPEREPRIHFQTLPGNGHVELAVSDNGLGIARSQQHKLFAMFKRLHNQGEGSGIGLYITKRIVENQGGSIAVESQEGLGSTFRVYFQVIPQEARLADRASG